MNIWGERERERENFFFLHVHLPTLALKEKNVLCFRNIDA